MHYKNHYLHYIIIIATFEYLIIAMFDTLIIEFRCKRQSRFLSVEPLVSMNTII